MAGQFTRLQKSYRIAADNVNPTTSKNEIPRYRGVVHVGEDTCKLPTDANEIPLGVVDNDERLDDPLRDGGSQAGRQIAVKLEGIAMCELSDTVSVTDRIIMDGGGKFKKMPASAGTYNVFGFAEKAGKAGDVIPVRMVFHVVRVESTPVVPKDGRDILTFTIPGQVGESIIDTETHTVVVEVVNGTDLDALTPSITVSEGASIGPASGVTLDFNSPVVYTVASESGKIQFWTVIVTVAEPDDGQGGQGGGGEG